MMHMPAIASAGFRDLMLQDKKIAIDARVGPAPLRAGEGSV